MIKRYKAGKNGSSTQRVGPYLSGINIAVRKCLLVCQARDHRQDSHGFSYRGRNMSGVSVMINHRTERDAVRVQRARY